jgi:hypothetical protein
MDLNDLCGLWSSEWLCGSSTCSEGIVTEITFFDDYSFTETHDYFSRPSCNSNQRELRLTLSGLFDIANATAASATLTYQSLSTSFTVYSSASRLEFGGCEDSLAYLQDNCPCGGTWTLNNERTISRDACANSTCPETHFFSPDPRIGSVMLVPGDIEVLEATTTFETATLQKITSCSTGTTTTGTTTTGTTSAANANKTTQTILEVMAVIGLVLTVAVIACCVRKHRAHTQSQTLQHSTLQNVQSIDDTHFLAIFGRSSSHPSLLSSDLSQSLREDFDSNGNVRFHTRPL